jgi:phthiodiolone/phenolphthiodiolone dimycocerosates ketoreductase
MEVHDGHRIAVGYSFHAMAPASTWVTMMRVMRLIGVDFVLVWDHLQNFIPQAAWDERVAWGIRPGSSPHEFYEADTLLGYLARVAGGVQIGTGVADVVRRHPVVMAQSMLTLSHLVRRPPILGLGAGERMGTEPYGLDPAPRADRLEEAIALIRTCFASRGPFDFEGRYFRADGAIVDLAPPPGLTPRIWVGAHGPRMLAVTGRQGDGWLPRGIYDPDAYASSLAAVRAAATAVGRDRDAITPALHVDLVLAPTIAEARELLDGRQVRLLAASAPASMWREAGRDHPLGDDFAGYREMLAERLDPAAYEAAVSTVPRQVAERMVIWGTRRSVLRRLQSLVEAGVRAFSLLPLVPTPRLGAYGVVSLVSITRALHRG